MPPIPCPTDYVAPTTLSGKACSWTEPPTHDLSVGIATKPRLNIPTDSVGRVLQSHIQDKRAEDSFFVADLGEVYRQYLQWRDWLPRVEPFYAVKCNPDPMVLRLLARLGLGFDCASRAELKKVLDLGVPSHQIVYANPCKQTSHLRFAADHDVRMLTFDNADELYKVKKHHPRAQVLLRVLTDDSKSLCKLGIKFGAPMDSTAQLLQLAHDLDLDVVGVSFHVGSGCQDASPFRDAVQRARVVFDQGKTLGFNMRLLDVGGGFPSALVKDGVTFTETAAVLRDALDEYFPVEQGVRIIAEPGRYFVSSAFTLAVSIIARRVVVRDQASPLSSPKIPAVDDTAVVNDQTPSPNDHPAYMYYVNDGVYGSFNCLMFDHATVYPEVLMHQGSFVLCSPFNSRSSSPLPHLDQTSLYDCSIWGPTCDSIDCIHSAAQLPELHVGDWLCFQDMGAYTLCAASQFNGFQPSRIIYTNSDNEVPEDVFAALE